MNVSELLSSGPTSSGSGSGSGPGHSPGPGPGPGPGPRPGSGSSLGVSAGAAARVWDPRAWAAVEAGRLAFRCRVPGCTNLSRTTEDDRLHLAKHIEKRRSSRPLRDRRPAPAPRPPPRAQPRPIAPLRAPGPAPDPPPAGRVAKQQAKQAPPPAEGRWRTSRPRSGNRIPLDQRSDLLEGGSVLKCGYEGCPYIA